jgi:hypothetical protein
MLTPMQEYVQTFVPEALTLTLICKEIVFAVQSKKCLNRIVAMHENSRILLHYHVLPIALRIIMNMRTFAKSVP